MAHPWSGNVRELEHVVEMLVLFSEGDVIGEEDLPRVLRKSGPHSSDAVPASFAKAVEGVRAEAPLRRDRGRRRRQGGGRPARSASTRTR